MDQDRQNNKLDDIQRMGTAFLQKAATGALSSFGVPVAIVTAVILLVTFIIIFGGRSGGAGGLGSSGQPAPGGGVPGGGNPAPIISCNFTYKSDQIYTLKSPILASWITDAASTAGIPPAVLASFIMHESFGAATNFTDDSPK